MVTGYPCIIFALFVAGELGDVGPAEDGVRLLHRPRRRLQHLLHLQPRRHQHRPVRPRREQVVWKLTHSSDGQCFGKSSACLGKTLAKMEICLGCVLNAWTE